MNRRNFIRGLGGAAVAPALLWPLAARAQTGMPRIGYVAAGAQSAFATRVAGFKEGLATLGFVDGRNVMIDYRWAAGKNDALPALAAELVRRNVAMIVTPASTAAARVAEQATTTIPIVFAIGADPVCRKVSVDRVLSAGRTLTQALSPPTSNNAKRSASLWVRNTPPISPSASFATQ